MVARKIPYYLRSLAVLSRALARPLSLVPALFDRPARLTFAAGGSIEVGGRLDLLLVEEVMLSDVYGLSHLAGPARILDVGAGIGELAIAAGRRFPAARVVAFEPHPEAFARLSANVRDNGLTNVELHRVAVGRLASYELLPSSNTAEARVAPRDPVDGGIAVEGRRLSEHVGQGTDLLKIDCEGGELDVLESLEWEVCQRIDRIVVEYHRHLLPEADRALVSFLGGRSFTCEVHPDRYDPRTGLVVARRRR